jgi:hypothetical protein
VVIRGQHRGRDRGQRDHRHGNPCPDPPGTGKHRQRHQLRPEADAALLAHLLLAPFAPSLLHHLKTDRGTTQEQIKAGLDQLLGDQL